MQIMVPLTYAEIEDIHPTEAELNSKLALLNRKKTVLFLAMVNMLLSLYQKNRRAFVEVQGSLYTSLVSDEMFEKVKVKFASEQMGDRPLFHRQQVLALLKRSFVHCPEEGGYDLSTAEQGRYELGLAGLMMSDIIDSEDKQAKLQCDPKDAADAKRVQEEIVAQMLPGVELLNPPDIIKSFVRNTEYFKIFERQSADGQLLFSNRKTLFDKFEEIAGLNLYEYLRMVIAVVLYYIHIGQKHPAELINDPKLFNINANEVFANMRFSPEAVGAFFNLSALPIDGLEERLRSHQETLELPEEYDFTILRRYPMVYTREPQDIMTCCDAGFLTEKTANGVYFTIHNSLKDRAEESEEAEKDHKSLMSHWGKAFEIYVNDRLWNVQHAPDLRDFYPAPDFTVPPEGRYPQAFDAALDYKSKLVVMEHKGKFARLKPRCSGDREQLLRELKEGDVIGKAVVQLARNLSFVFNNQSPESRHTFYVRDRQRVRTYGLNYIRKVRYVYPIIVHQDYFLRMNGVTHMARDLFRGELAKHPIDPELVRPLTLITVEELEHLIPYLKVKPLPQILEKYFLFTDPYDTFHNFFMWFLKKNGIKEIRNEWIDQRSQELWDEMTAAFIDLSDN